MPNEGRRLDSWKAIAVYLGRDVRTVIRWEQTRGLPVRRMPGQARGPVYAFQHEIDAWLVSHAESADTQVTGAEDAPDDRSASSGGAATTAPTSETLPQRSKAMRWGMLAGMAAVLCAASALLLYGRDWGRPQPQVARMTFTAQTVKAWDEDDHILWEHRFPEPFATGGDSADVRAVFGEDQTPDSATYGRLVDLNGDGKKEVVAVTAFRQKNVVTPETRQILWCFAPDGKLLWSYEPKDIVTFGTHSYGAPWEIHSFISSDESGPQSLWVLVRAYEWGKSFVVKLDRFGRPSIRFVNTGEVDTLARVHTSHGAETWIGGFNDEYDTASLAIIRDEDGPSASPQTTGTRFVCVSCKAASPYAYVLFPRYDMSVALRVPATMVYAITADSLGNVEVRQAEISKNDQVFYDFSDPADLSKLVVRYSSTFWNSHADLERQGKLRHSLRNCPDRLHPPSVRLFRSGMWVTVPVLS